MKSKRILIVMGAALILGASSASALVHDVGPGKTYATLGDALAVAGANDEIVMYAGTYTEAVQINKLQDGLHIHSNPGDKVVIQGSINMWNTDSADFVEQVVIEGLYFDLTGQASGWASQAQYARNNTYKYNVFYGDGSGAGGIYSYLNYGLNLSRHNTFYGLGAPYSAGYGGGLHVFDSIVADSLYQPYNYPGWAGVATYSDYYNTLLPTAVGDTTGTIFSDPQFASTDPNDPHFLWLNVGSPAANAAGDGLNMGALPTVPEPASLVLISLCGALMLRRRARCQ